MSADPLVVVVHGKPAPQGSKRLVGQGHLIESSAGVKPWRQTVAFACRDAWRTANGDQLPNFKAAYAVALVFTMARPLNHYRSGKAGNPIRDGAPAIPAVTPDLDKLIRSTLDGLADSGAIVNDSRVVEIAAVKTYPAGHLDALDVPGVVITLREIGQT